MEDLSDICRAAVEAAPCGMFVCDDDGTFVLVNARFEQLTGFSAAELVARRTFLSLHDPAELSRRADAPHRDTAHHGQVAQRLAMAPGEPSSRRFEGEPVHHGEWTYLRADGVAISVWLSLSVVPYEIPTLALAPATKTTRSRRSGASNTRFRYVGVVSSGADFGEEQARLEYLSHHDSVTRLPNQALLRARMEQLIRRCALNGRVFSILVIEHDQLRKLQDSLGPAAVDIALQITAERLRAMLALDDALACVGATQFFVVLVDAPESADSVAQQLIARLAEPIMCLGTAVQLSASAGLSMYPRDAAEASALMRNAVIALNRARAAGGGTVRHFSGEMQSYATRRLELETSLRLALEQHQFSLAYQPQINLKSGKIDLVEALLRWTHPTEGVIGPVEFIPVAEESGLILPIGEWVIRTACAQASLLLRKFGASPRIAINVSPLQFQRQNLLEIVERALADAALEPRFIEIEVTEGVLLNDTEQALSTLHALRKMGVEVAIDDFGTGYSSLSYLTRFEVDRLKIDRTFVRAMSTDRDSAAIVSAIIAMAHALNIRVTAEGVETRAQVERLSELHCDEAQGYWFSRPLAPRALENLLTPLD